MTLKEYLNKHKISPKEFSKLINLKGAKSIYKYFNGTVPRADIMGRIVEATGSKVTANDFYRRPK